MAVASLPLELCPISLPKPDAFAPSKIKFSSHPMYRGIDQRPLITFGNKIGFTSPPV
jgi:hypothetical protein